MLYAYIEMSSVLFWVFWLFSLSEIADSQYSQE